MHHSIVITPFCVEQCVHGFGVASVFCFTSTGFQRCLGVCCTAICVSGKMQMPGKYWNDDDKSASKKRKTETTNAVTLYEKFVETRFHGFHGSWLFSEREEGWTDNVLVHKIFVFNQISPNAKTEGQEREREKMRSGNQIKLDCIRWDFQESFWVMPELTDGYKQMH